jgi:MFS transporter, DHA1 family, multidrug resistance protein
MVRDLFFGDEIVKTFSTLMLVIGISPILAPITGSWITTALGWHYIFLSLSIMAFLLLLLVVVLLPESRQPDTNVSLNLGSIINKFGGILKHRRFFTYAFTGSIATASFYVYLAGSPFLFMEYFKVTEQQYGWIFALIAIGLIGATQLNRVALKHFKSEQIIKFSLYCELVLGTIFLVGTLFGVLNLFSTLILISMFFWCQGFLFPNTSALSLMPFTKNAGSASALLGFVQMCIGAIVSALISVIQTNSAFPMAMLMLICATLAFFTLMIGERFYSVVTPALTEN